LRFAFFEGGIGWVPWLMTMLDHHMPSEAPVSTAVRQFFKGEEKIKKSPGEYFRHFYIAAVSWEHYLPEIVKVWPDHNIIIGSDFDHGDAISTWPNTVKPIKEMAGLPEEEKEKILGGNIMRLFKMSADSA
jgi:predicted TIM-barrel fold metal-dependent hydrolase